MNHRRFNASTTPFVDDDEVLEEFDGVDDDEVLEELDGVEDVDLEEFIPNENSFEVFLEDPPEKSKVKSGHKEVLRLSGRKPDRNPKILRSYRMWIPWLWFLKDDEQALIETFTKRRVVNGPGAFLTMPFVRTTRRKAITLDETQYLHLTSVLTGESKVELGPKLFFLGANEVVEDRADLILLQANQYVKLQDTITGAIRVERGESSVYLNPKEVVLQNPVNGINIDEHTAVVVRDIETGQLDLVTKHQVFMPAANQEIVRESQRIRLENQDTVVIKDRTGKYIFRSGSDSERSFFLDPYSQLVKFNWSTGIHKDQRSLVITQVDSRPKFMWYEFEARTQDNVELVLGITFFWQITDVEKMIGTTDDTPGDICSHARSAIIQSVSRVTLEAFLSDFNTVVRKAVLESGDNFYSERGVRLHAVEVRSISCKDPDTQRVLQEIIRETTNRLSRVQKQESENEIRIKQLTGEIESEEMRRGLLEIQQKNSQTAARMEGVAEALRVSVFLDVLGSKLTAAEKVAVFNTLRKRDMLKDLSEGSAQLYFTPNEVDLAIETRQGPVKAPS